MTIEEAYQALRPLSKQGYVSVQVDYRSYRGEAPHYGYIICIDGVLLVSSADRFRGLESAVAHATAYRTGAAQERVRELREQLSAAEALAGDDHE